MSTPTAGKVVIEAAKHLGYHEGKTGGVYDNTTVFGRRYGWDGVAWCQIYMWCIFQDAGGGKLVPKTASCSEAYGWFRVRGRTGHTPAIGALIYFGPGNHVGIVETYTGSHVTYISGNTSDHPGGPANAVERKTIRRSTVGIFYAYPAYAKSSAKAPKPKLITVRRGQTLTGIAAAAGITLAVLLAANPSYRSHPNVIHPGDKIVIPATAPKKPAAKKPAAKPKPKPSPTPEKKPTP